MLNLFFFLSFKDHPVFQESVKMVGMVLKETPVSQGILECLVQLGLRGLQEYAIRLPAWELLERRLPKSHKPALKEVEK